MKKTKKIFLPLILILAVVVGVVYEISIVQHGKIDDQAVVVTFYDPNTKDIINHSFVLLNVPFVSQAPLGHWYDPRQETGCEVTSVLMAWLWINKQTIEPVKAENEIISGASFEVKQYGGYFNFDYNDAVKLMNDYYHYDKIKSVASSSIEDIKDQLRQGNIVLLPILGRRLDNPYYTPPGPPTHMIVVRGFDDAQQQFITNDPGTKRGDEFRYSYATIASAMVDYPSNHRSTKGIPKTMVVVEK
jgi:uncharacterized protein YvpB